MKIFVAPHHSGCRGAALSTRYGCLEKALEPSQKTELNIEKTRKTPASRKYKKSTFFRGH
jgi:hypothetical protein